MGMKDLLPYLMSTAETMKRNMRNPGEVWDSMTRPMDNPNPSDPLLVPGKDPKDLALEYAMSWGMPAAYLGRGFSRDILNPSRESRVPSNMSRRDFLKQGAGLTAGAVAAKYGLGKIGAVEGRTGKEVAEAIAPKAATKAAPKYKYNSLQEYLDDVNERAIIELKEAAKQAGKPSDYYLSGKPHKFSPLGAERRRILEQDEAAYKTAKSYNSKPRPLDVLDDFADSLNRLMYKDKLNEFSPAAKEQMSNYKAINKGASRDFNGDLPDNYNWSDEIFEVINRERPVPRNLEDLI